MGSMQSNELVLTPPLSNVSIVKSCMRMKPWAHRALFLLTLILANLFFETFSEVNNQTMTVKKLGSLLENFGQQLSQLKNETDIANEEIKIDMKNLKNTFLKLVNHTIV